MNKNEKIFFLVLIIQNLAFNFAHPVTPTLIRNLNLPSFSFGVAFAAMALSSFLFSKFWAYISTNKNEKMVFCVGCVFYGLAQILFMVSKSIAGIVLARFIGGIFISAINVSSLMYIIKISSEERKGTNIALFTSLTAVMTAFGYLIGGFVGNEHIEYSFILQCFTLIACGFIFAILGIRTHEKKQLNKNKIIKSFNLFKELGITESIKHIHVLLLIILLTFFASTIYEQTFNYFIRDVFEIMPASTGIIKTITGFCIIFINTVVGNKLVKSNNLSLSTIVVFALCSITCLISILLLDKYLFLVLSFLFMSLSALQMTFVQKIFVDVSSNEAIGTYNCMKSLGWVFGGLIAGYAYELSTLLPFEIVSVVFVIAFILLYRFKVKD